MSGDFIRTFQRALYSRVALVGSILVCAFLFFQLVQVVSRSASTGKEIASLRSEVESLQTEQKRLEQLRSFLQTDFFAEQEARTKFGLQKEGEHALILSKQNSEPRSDPHDGSTARSDTQSTADRAARGRDGSLAYDPNEQEKNYHRWWQFFFGRE